MWDFPAGTDEYNFGTCVIIEKWRAKAPDCASKLTPNDC